GKLRRFDVNAFADPDARLKVGERADVVESPPKVRLQDDAEVLVAGLAELAIKAQRVVGRRGVLHVDANKVAPARRLADHRLEVLAAEVVVELQPERGQLHAHVRVEPLPPDRLEDVAVGACDRTRLVGWGRWSFRGKDAESVRS